MTKEVIAPNIDQFAAGAAHVANAVPTLEAASR